jgi:hypothetical protein
MLLNELSWFKAWPGQWVQLAGLLHDFAGAWWVGWCLSQLSLFQSVAAAVHHTQRCSACYQTWLFVCKKKIIQAFLGVFEKKSGANVSKL